MMRDHDEDAAIAAWDAYSAAHKGYVETHASPDEHEPHHAEDGAGGPAPGRRAEDPASSVTIDRTVEMIGAHQALTPEERQSEG